MSSEKRLTRHLSPLGAWAFAVGTSVGWGSLVVTANTYLVQAGPMGSALGLVLGALVMLVMCFNYGYLLKRHPDAGGAYAYTREVFGYDQGFLTAWFLAMTYFAMLWANATSLPLFGRIFLGGVFRFGRLYSLFGYEVYLGEALLSVAAILLGALLCVRHERVADAVMIGLALLFTAGIAVCFGGAAVKGGGMLEPAFVPDSAAIGQIVKIAVISPWAFIGFESISHAAEEIDFEAGRMRRVLVVAVISTLALYILVTLTSVAVHPPQYESWLDYIRDLDNLEGIEALPAFYVANACLGGFGLRLLMLALLALVVTSLIGNLTALSRLLYALAKDRILPPRFARLNGRGAPSKTLWLAAGVSCLVPLVGRTAIGWIVDVTTIGATLIYGFVSACAAIDAKNEGDARARLLGRAGLAAMVLFGVYILVPNLVSRGSLAKETFLLFIAWSVLGFLFFRSALKRDTEGRFGKSVIVWVALLSLVLFTSLVWMRQSMMDSNDATMANIQEYYATHDPLDGRRAEDERFIEGQMDALERSNTHTMLMAVGMFCFALAVMLNNHSYMNRRSRESERLANIDPMTGVKSKHAYLVREGELNGQIAAGEAPPFAVVVCDVNGLKKINDTLGHKAGDEYICAACKLVCEVFCHSPVFRIGGDEFVAILTGRDYESRRGLMLALHQRSVDHISRGGAVVSGGLSEYRQDEDRDVHAVFERADGLMYEEKQLLKGLGSVTRDETPEEMGEDRSADEQILNVRRKVLVVEDETVNRLMLGGALEEKYDVLYAEDGAEALAALDLQHNEISLVLTDLMMPNMDGMELLKRMKAEPATRGIPVIVMTADQDAELKCLKLGAMDFIPKPYPDWEIVRARVDKCVELSVNRDIIQSTERDGLTKLFNVDYFMRYVRMFDQHYQDMAMDAVAIDVNRFHMLNERYGRQYGDDILKRIGETLRTLAREAGGVGCRLGGDTFMLYCPHREDYSDYLTRISAALAEAEKGRSRVRLRMGVYANVDTSLDIERRFDRARLAAERVKNSSGSVGVYDAGAHEAALLRERLLEDFPGAIAEGRFPVFLQPKFDIRHDEPLLSSAEALTRWDHPELGRVSPAEFIPLLEENGLILELDKYVWRRTAAMIRDWKDRLGYSVPVSVNVSRIDMLTPNLKGIFMEILNEYRLTTDDLALEITESAYTEDSEQVISTARDLRGMGMGFRIEMDDFGAGKSSLGMLSRLPIDALKLDMSFVQSAFGETRDMRMIELIIDIADYLGVPVVAEGVETEEQYLTLKAMGCDLVQGYYFSRPLPAGEFDRFILERAARGEVAAPAARRGEGISGALTDGFESIYYIDLNTDFYLEFHTGPDGGVMLRPGGASFFDDARGKLIAEADGADAPRLAQALSRENLTAWAADPDAAPVAFRRAQDGAFTMQPIRTRARDEHHVVIGFSRE